MSTQSGLEALAQGAILSPFTRLARLLEGIIPGHEKVIELTIGDPKERMPEFVIDRMAEAKELLGTYPKIRGSDELRQAIASWIERRYGLAGRIDAAREVLPINGSREGLFYAMLPAVGRKQVQGRPVVLLPNPFYHTYLGAAYATNCEPYFLNATEATGHLPDLDALERETDILERTVAFYLCSPANPQGAVAKTSYTMKALELARRYDFVLFFDECYSEIYTGEPPTGGLELRLRPRTGSAISSSSTLCQSVPTCPDCALVSLLVTANFSKALPRSETLSRPKCRVSCSMPRRPFGPRSSMLPQSASPIGASSTYATRSWQVALVTAGRRVASSYGSM